MSFHMRTFTAEKLLISPAAGLDVMNCVEWLGTHGSFTYPMTHLGHLMTLPPRPFQRGRRRGGLERTTA